MNGTIYMIRIELQKSQWCPYYFKHANLPVHLYKISSVGKQYKITALSLEALRHFHVTKWYQLCDIFTSIVNEAASCHLGL